MGDDQNGGRQRHALHVWLLGTATFQSMATVPLFAPVPQCTTLHHSFRHFSLARRQRYRHRLSTK